MALDRRMEDRNDERDDLLASDKPSEDRFKAIRELFAMDQEAVQDLYAECARDFKFAWIPGNQWDSHMSALRGKRPQYEFNILRQTIKQVINDNRQNTPSIKVRAVEDGDKDAAELRQGIIHNIESRSKADEAYDWAGLYAITAGFGVVEVETEYASDDTFDQDICIKRVENPFSVYFDCAARKLDRTDARRAWKIETMPRTEFKARYPDAQYVDFDAREKAVQGGWFDRDTVRVAAYWYKKRKSKRIYRLSDGRVVDADGFDEIAEIAANPPLGPDGQPIMAPVTIDVDAQGRKVERTVEYDQVMKEIISGKETLEGPFEWAGKYIPLIPFWGDIVCDEGVDYFYGMVRPSRDAQILFNYSQSNLVEVIAAQPKAPWLYTPAMVLGHENAWANSAVENAAGLPYNPDPQAPGGRPTREAPPAFGAAWFELARINQDNLKAVTGIHDASLGAKSNETSGRAILARQQEGDVANFDYSDNINRGIQAVGMVVNDLIPAIIDAEREVRILGEDQSEKFVTVNKPILVDGKWVKQNDLSQGKFDIVVTTGPSFTTQRMETLNAMSELAKGQGPMAMLGALGVMEHLDVPGTDKYISTMRKMMIAQGVPLEPEEGEQPPAPPQPDPKALAGAEKDAAQAANYRATAEQTELETQLLAMQAGMQMGQVGMPPPAPPPDPNQMMPPEPAQAGFFMGETPPQGTAPGGFPG